MLRGIQRLAAIQFTTKIKTIKFTTITRQTYYHKPLEIKTIKLGVGVGILEKMEHHFRIGTRFISLGILFGPLFIVFPVWYILEFKIFKSPEYWWIDWLVWTLEHSGPTFTKLGQWASSRVDLFPEEVCVRLAKLQSESTPHSFQDTLITIESAYGKKMTEIFDEFDPQPVGVGAIAQVYKGTLRNGRKVAVKVLHPHANELVHLDLKIMLGIARFIEFIIPDSHWLSLPDEVEMFSFMMKQQLDLSLEGRHLDQFERNFQKWSLVGFPKAIEYSHPNVLIESWVDGIPMEKFLRMGPSLVDKKIATLGLSSFLKMMILDNHVHADMHPGNIFVTFQKIPESIHEEVSFLPPSEIGRLQKIRNRAEWQQEMETLYGSYSPYLIYVDAGLTSQLSPRLLNNFIDLFKAITEFDGSLISQLMVARSKYPDSVQDFEGFSNAMQMFMDDIKASTLKLKNIQVSDILSFVLHTVRKHHVKIDGDYANVAVAIMLLEGIGRQLEPEMDLLKAAGPFLQEAIRTRLEGDVSTNEQTIWNFWRDRGKRMVDAFSIFK